MQGSEWMIHKILSLNLLLKIGVSAVLMFVPAVAMAISCTITSAGLSTTHTPNAALPNITQSSLTLTCSRGALEIATSTTYSISVNNGINAAGAQNNAKLSSNIQYETYKASDCNSAWSSASPITGSLGLPTSGTQYSTTINYWGCIPINQQVPAGTYLDTVTMTVTYSDPLIIIGGTSTINNTFPVSITNLPVCSITSIGNVNFGTYLAFRSTALVAPNATITLNCTPEFPYALALDANNGVVAGLNYALSLSATNSAGTGPNQTHTIGGTMPANQAGTCATGSCTAADPRTLTITY
jgi:spore coat protein U-like protein